jgi:hypothetical protein
MGGLIPEGSAEQTSPRAPERSEGHVSSNDLVRQLPFDPGDPPSQSLAD